MGLDLFTAAVGLLMCFAIFDLIVGVGNDAVNFLNSAIGSRAAPRVVIMVIASLGILVGVTFSSGMMEVARKGIFHPARFTMPDLMTIFLAVMLTDIILLDLFSTFGLPTSTTVSIVFELLGAAVAVSVLKVVQSSGDLVEVLEYINTGKAMIIILGILLSVVVAFACGVVAQFLSRLLLTFDYKERLKRYGAAWGGIALTSILYFILVKGAKGSTIIAPETAKWIKDNPLAILLPCLVASSILLQVLLFLRVNILKPIVLIGTFALAMAFAANDLVNFIGVPMAGLHAYQVAAGSGDQALSMTMDALGEKVQPESYLILLAGVVMVVTLWLSRKARTVTETEVGLGQQQEGEERFDSTFLSRAVVRMVITVGEWVRPMIPGAVRDGLARRLDPSRGEQSIDAEGRPSFDLLRASVNLMVASAVISYATSHKLPLSTTYVTFMVAMGTSFADQAWGRDSAVYRITGVLTVIGGWFMTAIMAFTISCLFAIVIFYMKGLGVAGLLLVGILVLLKNHRKHVERVALIEEDKVFNLQKVTDASATTSTTFEHVSHLLRDIRESLDAALDALFVQNEYRLAAEKRRAKKIQRWANIIIANIFKSLRLVQKREANTSYKYAQTIRRVQKLGDGHRDIVMRAHSHVSNQHKGLLGHQVEELRRVKEALHGILRDVEETFARKQPGDRAALIEKDQQLRKLAEALNREQVARIKDDTSKTRLSILYYAIVGNAMMLSKQCLKLLEIFDESFSHDENSSEFDLD